MKLREAKCLRATVLIKEQEEEVFPPSLARDVYIQMAFCISHTDRQALHVILDSTKMPRFSSKVCSFRASADKSYLQMNSEVVVKAFQFADASEVL